MGWMDGRAGSLSWAGVEARASFSCVAEPVPHLRTSLAAFLFQGDPSKPGLGETREAPPHRPTPCNTQQNFAAPKKLVRTLCSNKRCNKQGDRRIKNEKVTECMHSIVSSKRAHHITREYRALSPQSLHVPFWRHSGGTLSLQAI